MNQLSQCYVCALDSLLLYNPKKTPSDIRCEIDHAQYEIDINEAPRLFKTAWNQSVSSLTDALIHGEATWLEWRWAISPLIVSVRHVFAAAVRHQFQNDDEQLEDQDTHSDKALTLSHILTLTVIHRLTLCFSMCMSTGN